jgi:hypothetical protein
MLNRQPGRSFSGLARGGGPLIRLGNSPVDSIDSRASLTRTVAAFADAQRMQRQPIDQPRKVPCGGASGMCGTGCSTVTGCPAGS